MAAKPDALVQVTVNFEGSRSVLHLPKNMKIGLAIQKAAEQFKQDPRGLTFLYHGLEITDDMTVGVALAQAHSVTVIHMIRMSNKKRTTATIMPNIETEVVYGYCKECDSLSSCREVFLCSLCHKPDFQRSCPEPLKHFSGNYNSAHLLGSCTFCQAENVQAEVVFECKGCDNGTRVGPLRQVRTNTHNVGCMKCGLTSDIVFRFACQSRHCMCVECFGNMCKQLLHTNQFKNFDNMGYSVSCPGSGPDCKTSPVPDPHHFKIVDEEQKFYKQFQQVAMEQFQPPGDNLLCGGCKSVIDFSRSEKADVKEPEGAQLPSVSGLKWYHKLGLVKQPTAPTPRVRGKTTCSKCKLTYCVGCKQVWHEGDCRVVNDDVLKAEQAYPIRPEIAKDGCWPEDKD